MIDVEELRKYLKIDKSSLDDELVQQADLFFRISEACTEAIDRRDALKEELGVVDADLDQDVRDDFEKTGEKYSNASVAALVKTDKKHEKAYKAFSEAKNLAERLLALKESFIQRSHMLKHLCQLYVSNYFEHSSIQGTSETDRAAYNQTREKLASARQRRQLR